jgi:hypothetical protein
MFKINDDALTILFYVLVIFYFYFILEGFILFNCIQFFIIYILGTINTILFIKNIGGNKMEENVEEEKIKSIKCINNKFIKLLLVLLLIEIMFIGNKIDDKFNECKELINDNTIIVDRAQE